MQTLIQVLTATALAGLLGTVGLLLTWHEVRGALRRCRIVAILVANFVLVPALSVATARLLGLSSDVAVAMILLAAAPFAPVVPIFARMARADLALAAGLTAVYPLASVLLTPLAAKGALALLAHESRVQLNFWSSLAVLLVTISLPLCAGVWIRHHAPRLGRRLLGPVDVIAATAGATSLALVTVMEWRSIVDVGWRGWVAMVIAFELSLAIGWALGGPATAARRVVALGTSNRNIALALLVALQSFSGTPIVSAVVGNGLLLIGLGLVHVAWWRFVSPSQPRSSS